MVGLKIRGVLGMMELLIYQRDRITVSGCVRHLAAEVA